VLIFWAKQIILHIIILLEHPIVAQLGAHVLLIVLQVHILTMQRTRITIGKVVSL